MMVVLGEICIDFLVYLNFDMMVLILLVNDYD